MTRTAPESVEANGLCNPFTGTKAMTEQKWILHWRYDDGSASGVLPRILTDEDKKLLELAEDECGFIKCVEYVKVPDGVLSFPPKPLG